MMSTVKLYSTVPSASDLLQYIEEDVLSPWTVGFFSHYLSVLSVREAKYPIVQFFLNPTQILAGRHRCI